MPVNPTGSAYGWVRRNVLGLVAIFIAISGSALAVETAKKNSVTSKSIKNGEVRSADVRDAGIESGDVASNAVDGTKVADNSLRGADIDESSLSGVDAATAATAGSAGSAANADRLDELDSTDFTRSNAALGGDLAGNLPSPTIANNAVGGAEIADGSLRRQDIGVLTANPAVDPPSIPAGSCQFISVAVPGVQPTDTVVANLNTSPVGVTAIPYDVLTLGNVDFWYCNPSAVAVNSPSHQWTLLIIR